MTSAKTMPWLTIPEYSDATAFSSLLCTQDVLDQFLLNLNKRTPKKSCRFKFMTLPFSIFTEISSEEDQVAKRSGELIYYYQVYLIYFKHIIVIKTLLHIIKSHPLSSYIKCHNMQNWVESGLNLLRPSPILE